jgi:hypothetical protein
MIAIQQEDSVGELSLSKAQYVQQTTAPLDGMWLIWRCTAGNTLSLLSGI